MTHKLRTKLSLNKTLRLNNRQPGSVIKILHNRSLKLFQNFHGKTHLLRLKTAGLFLRKLQAISVIILVSWLRKFSSLGHTCQSTRKSLCFGHLEKLRALTPVSNLLEYFLQELNLEAWFLVQKCEAILNDVLLLLCTNSLRFGPARLRHTIKTSTHGHGCQKNLPGQSMNNGQWAIHE